jgi:hypothetical protein
MLTPVRRVWLSIVLAGLSAACVGWPPPTPSIGPSATAPAQAGLPEGCEPLDLRGPDGETVDLSGSWAGSGILAISADEVVVLNQVGGCVYGSMTGPDGNGQQAVTILVGRINPNFTIDFEVVTITRPARDPVFRYPFAESSTVVMVIEWDGEGRLRLREDREPGEIAERCVQPTLPCPDPVIWYPVEEGPTS